jgi:hypothetical protein
MAWRGSASYGGCAASLFERGACQRQRSVAAGAEILSTLNYNETPNTENPGRNVRELATIETKVET